MALRDLLRDVAEGWPSYRRLQTTRKDHPEYELVVRTVPRELKPLLPSGPSFKVEGSTGRGNITAAPWIATFDRSITSSATHGYYLVYLYSVDLQRLYLALAFGTTQFEEYFSKPEERHRRLRSAASHLQALLSKHRPVHSGPLNLAAGRADRMHLDSSSTVRAGGRGISH